MLTPRLGPAFSEPVRVMAGDDRHGRFGSAGNGHSEPGGAAADEAALEAVRVAALGKKGAISELLKGLGAHEPG
jgi:hypothetical protein